MPTAPVTWSAALNHATRALSATSPSPRLDAEALLMHLVGVGRATLIIRAADALEVDRYQRYQQLVARRLAGEPVAYITGVREFWSLPLKVTPAVLIPRPETELLVECALAHLSRNADCTAAELGTGSGAVALAIAHERSHCRVLATDTSADALDVARENARRLGLTNVEFRAGDWLVPLAGKQFDVIVSNPPYVRADDPHLDRGDVRFEPKTALIGGADGLDAIRQIVAHARARLRSGGWLLLEHGYTQAEAVAELLRHAEFHETQTHRDLANQIRVTAAR